MSFPERAPRNAFVSFSRKIYNPLGFSKGYNFILFFIFAGALMGFVLARFRYLDFDGRFCPPIPATDGSSGAPSQCYWVQFPRYRIGLLLHLATILPAGFLAVFQFVPAVRHNFTIYHRITGYLIILLVIIGNVGAVMIADRSMGGDIPTRTFTGFVAIATSSTLALAVYNIKKQQIDQHRAWMLRTWFYLGFIITLRIVQILIAVIISAWGDAVRYDVMTCDELRYITKDQEGFYSQFPACEPGNARFTADGYIAVRADLGNTDAQSMAAIGVSFSAAGYLALALHAIGVEIYLHLTQREAERLRLISYQRQLQRGYKNPGSAGLVADRFGDVNPWQPEKTATMDAIVVGPEVPKNE